MIEELDDIVDELADQLGIYNAHGCACSTDKPCRVCWAASIKSRIRQAVGYETRLLDTPQGLEVLVGDMLWQGRHYRAFSVERQAELCYRVKDGGWRVVEPSKRPEVEAAFRSSGLRPNGRRS